MRPDPHSSNDKSAFVQGFSDPASCRLCPRRCGADRRGLPPGAGVCGMGADAYVSRAALHMWEEPCLSGCRGSGAVFFAGCNLGCVFCQNRLISHPAPGSLPPGRPVSPEHLAEIFLRLQERQKAHNINLVPPSHFVPAIAEALKLARRQGLRLPVIYNSGGYDLPQALRLLDGLVDIYLPDFKYWSSELAALYSKAPDYPEVARAALGEMFAQAASPRFDREGMMVSGVMVRLLLLPGCLKDAEAVLDYLFAQYGNRIFYSIMNQYTPVASPALEAFPGLCRPVKDNEYEALLDYAQALGIENAFIQEGGAVSESFIPDFNDSGL